MYVFPSQTRFSDDYLHLHLGCVGERKGRRTVDNNGRSELEYPYAPPPILYPPGELKVRMTAWKVLADGEAGNQRHFSLISSLPLIYRPCVLCGFQDMGQVTPGLNSAGAHLRVLPTHGFPSSLGKNYACHVDLYNKLKGYNTRNFDASYIHRSGPEARLHATLIPSLEGSHRAY